MKIEVKYVGASEKQVAIDNNASLHLIEERRHIVGTDEAGKFIYEESLVFSDKPNSNKVLTIDERIEALEARIKVLEGV